MSETVTTEHVPEALGAMPAWYEAKTSRRTRRASEGFIVDVTQDLQRLPQWPVLGREDPDAKSLAFQRREVLEVWLETIGRGLNVTPLFVSIHTCKGEPVMLLPLGIGTRHGLKVLSFLDGGVADYNAPVLYPRAALLSVKEIRFLWREICRAVAPFDLVRLEKMPDFAGGIKNPLRALACRRWYISGHYLSLNAVDALQSSIPDPKESRRKRRRLAEHGEVRFGIAQSASDINIVLEVFLRQKSRRYMESLGHPGFDVPGQISYYRSLAQRFSGHGVQLAPAGRDGPLVVPKRHFDIRFRRGR